jgi:transposase
VFELHLLLTQIDFSEQQIKQITDVITRLMKERKPVIVTIPGIGPLLGAAILGEIGDVSRFRGPKKLVAFAGLDATVHQSGQYESTRHCISKRGSPRLRRALWLAAVNAIRRDAYLGNMYHTQIARGKPARVAIGAVARKLTHLIYYLCLRNRAYDPGYCDRSRRISSAECAVA